jgi:ABC-type branched-subunit amino acid transport system substrate-binding protein
MKAHRKQLLSLAAVTALAGGLAACGSDDEGGSDGNAVTVMLVGQYEAEGSPLPQGRDAALAAVERINADGGMNGHTIEVVVCDDKRDPNLAVKCAREAVQERVAAVLSTEVNFTEVVLPVLSAAKIPLIKGVATSPQDFSEEGVWSFLSGAISAGGATGVAMADAGCKNPSSLATDAASSQFLVKATATGLTAAGVKTQEPAQTVAIGQPDFAPVVSSLVSKGVDCLGMAIIPGDILKVAQTIAQTGADIRIFSIANSMPQEILDAIDGAVDVTLLSDFPPLDDPAITELDQYRADLEKADVPLDGHSAHGWSLIHVIGQLLETIDGEVDAAAVTKALESADAIDIPGSDYDVDFTTPFEVDEFSRLFNHRMHVQKVEGTKPTELGEPLDLTDFYKEFADAI